MVDALDYISEEEFDLPSEYVDEKVALITTRDLSIDDRVKLGQSVYQYMTAWRSSDGLPRLLQLTSIAVAVDNSKASEAINEAIQLVIPILRDNDPELIECAENILSISSAYFRTIKFKAEYSDFRDLFEAEVISDPVLLAQVACVLLDPEKRAGSSITLKQVTDIAFASTANSMTDEKQLYAFSTELIAGLPLKYWASALPDLKLSSDESRECTACRFVRYIFAHARPLLLLLNLRDNEWLVRATELHPDLSLSPEELEDHLKEIGEEMVSIPHLQSDLVGEEFFDRIANARQTSLAFIEKFRNNVVPIFPGVSVEKIVRDNDDEGGDQS
ncbi:hypothetical protein KUV51_08930 [Tateyamaria omphalii]|uniref:hypothetical protein n=1 Tax=Tateyamaria omphalii TaxID=299262 RepID=UPI001C9973FB|nr:hypothetical protein [Tateyamaria omphalii]MBY5933117.1 hypothetical protein [Tateyamaria omphalii]